MEGANQTVIIIEKTKNRHSVTQAMAISVGLIAISVSSCEKSGQQSPATKTPGQIENTQLSLTSISNNPADSWQKIDDPTTDGWDTEILAALAAGQLKQLGKLYFNAGNTAALVTSDFVSDPLTPRQLSTIFQDKVNTIQRGQTITPKRGGLEILDSELHASRERTAEAKDAGHFEFKVIGVTTDENSPHKSFATEVLFSLTITEKKAVTEDHANWLIRWHQDTGLPKIADIRVRSFTRSITKQNHTMFSDVTESALADNRCYSEQLSYGMNHWLSRLPVRAMLNRFGTPGIALGDVNGDDLEDLYLCQEPGLPNRLFLQQPDGSLRDVSAQWGVDWIEDSRSAILADFDNDGDQDLAVAFYGLVIVARNDDEKHFKTIAALPTSWSTTSLSAADYNNDGLLDIFVCAYVQEDNGESIGAANNQFVYHDAENGAGNSFFQNTTTDPGSLSFAEVTDKVGLNKNNQRWSFAASWEDFDNDGDQDLYVANDYGRNNLYRNDGGYFSDIAPSSNIEDSASGMSVTWADYDGNGLMDLYVSNMFSAAGSRITAQKNFKTGTEQGIRERFRRFSRGNSLFRNTGKAFEENSSRAGVAMGRWAWGSNFVDFNNDSWPDLVIANGYLSSEGETGDL